MKEKMKEFVTDMVAMLVHVVLLMSFVLGFLFPDMYVFPCIVIGGMTAILMMTIFLFRGDRLCAE